MRSLCAVINTKLSVNCFDTEAAAQPWGCREADKLCLLTTDAGALAPFSTSSCTPWDSGTSRADVTEITTSPFTGEISNLVSLVNSVAWCTCSLQYPCDL